MSTNIQRDQAKFRHAAMQLNFPFHQLENRSKTVQDAARKALMHSFRMIKEEAAEELLTAVHNYAQIPSEANLIELYDGAIDSIYVILDLLNTLALPFQEGWDEVHRSNMAKKGPSGFLEKDSRGKVMKPPGWTPPDLAKIIFQIQASKNGDDSVACEEN